MKNELNGHINGNANNDVKVPKAEYQKGIMGVKRKGRYVKPPYLRTNGK